MPAVLAQAPTPSPEVLPGGSPQLVPATPAGNHTPQTSNSSLADTEKPGVGAGSGVSLEEVTNPYQLQQFLDGVDLAADDEDLDSEVIPVVAPVVVAPAPAVEVLEPVMPLPGEIPRNLNLPIRSDLDFEVAKLLKADRLASGTMTFTAAEAQALKNLGREPAMPVVAPAPAAPEVAGAVAAAAMSPLDQAYADYQEARATFDDDGEVAALKRINDLNLLRAGSVQAEQAQLVQGAIDAQDQFLAAFNDSLQSARQAFPGAADLQSALTIRANEIQQSYAESNSPALLAIHRDPASPLLFYTQAARELGIAPLTTSSPKLTPQPVPVSRPPMSSLLTGGNTGARPAPLALSQEPTIANSHDLEAVIAANEEAWRMSGG